MFPVIAIYIEYGENTGKSMHNSQMCGLTKLTLMDSSQLSTVIGHKRLNQTYSATWPNFIFLLFPQYHELAEDKHILPLGKTIIISPICTVSLID